MTKARDLANIISGGFTVDDIPNLPASKITTGTFDDARIAASNVSQHATSFDDNKIVNDISTLALRQASDQNKSAYSTGSSSIDVFQDSTGIDTTTNVSRNASEHVSSISGTGDIYSGNFSSSNGGLRFTGSSNYVFTGDFTVEWWQKTSSAQVNYAGIYGTTNEAAWTTDAWWVGYYNNDIIFGNNSNFTSLTFNFGNSSHDNTWHHMALVRDGTTLRAYRDGVASTTTSTSYQMTLGISNSRIMIGSHEPGGNSASYQGLLDEFRLSNNCRYPSGTTFSVPSSSFTSDANTMLLIDFETTDFNGKTGSSGTTVVKDSIANNVLSQSTDTNVTVSATGNFTGTTITAPSSVSSMGAIITYQDQAGTNALNTDIVLQLSADGGSNYSTATLTALPDFSTGIKMAKVNDLSVTAGTQLKYKISFANQASGSKEARIRGVSLQY